MNEKKHFMLKCLPNLIFDGINSVKQELLIKIYFECLLKNKFPSKLFRLDEHFSCQNDKA
ncbi:hypothetical protein T4A_11141 [Trichinella pseudospiralis]|uniref:Uncharacterized protein n=1 Tax=Trichinella pseudospiralis TaxID=6337 RepID=A0A0V1E3H0_TRIPS|nr:hypothetical protein T4A_11141 [Trichinella pseudospiralis]